MMKYIYLFVLWFANEASSSYDVKEIRYGLYDINLDSEVHGLDESINLDELKETNIEEYAQEILKRMKDQDGVQQVVSKNGQRFMCTIPPVKYEKTDSGPKESYNPKYLSEIVSASFYVRKCVKQDLGWWKYEVCQGKSIKQIHGNPGDKDYVLNSLGYFTGRYEMPDFLESTKERLLYFEEMYDGGTACDLADNNQMRKTAIRFECNPKLASNEAYISDVQELSSCIYRITVKVGSLCNLKPFMISKQENAVQIKCKPFVSEEQLTQYLKEKVKEKEAKNFAVQLLHNTSLELVSIKRRKNAIIRTGLLRRPKLQAQRMARVTKQMDNVFERYFNYSFLVQNGKMPDAEAMKGLKTLATILGGVEIAFTDFSNEDDQDRAYLWYYFNDPLWDKQDFPFTLDFVDISNEYYENVKSIYGPFHKNLQTDPFNLNENVFMKNEEFAVAISATLSYYNPLASTDDFYSNFLEQSFRKDGLGDMAYTYVRSLWDSSPEKVKYELSYEEKTLQYIALIYNYIDFTGVKPTTEALLEEYWRSAALTLDHLFVARDYAMKTFPLNSKGSPTEFTEFYNKMCKKRTNEENAKILTDYKRKAAHRVLAYRRIILKGLWLQLSASFLKSRRDKDLDKILLAEKIRKKINSDKIVTEATISRDTLIELISATEIDTALKIEFYDVTDGTEEENTSFKSALEEEIEEQRHIRKVKEAFDIYERVI